jgi:hypothetical protein
VGTCEEVAVLTIERVLDKLPGALGICDASVQLGDLELGQLSPTLTSTAHDGDQPTDLGEGEAGVLTETNERDPLYARLRVVPSLSGTRGRREEADPLVVPEGRRRDARTPSQLTDRNQTLLGHGAPLT